MKNQMLPTRRRASLPFRATQPKGTAMSLSFRACRPVLGFAFMAMLAGGPCTVLAQNLSGHGFIKPGEETLTLNVGAILNQFNTHFRLDGQTSRGTDFKLENNGLNDSLSSFDISGTWRFAPRHRIDLEYFQAKRTGTHTYSNQITIGDTTFPIGADVSIEAKDRFLIGDYRYSFYKTDALEFAGLIGFYGGRFNFDISAKGNGGTSSTTVNRSVSTAVPLPMLGASLDWYINPQWKVAGSVEGIAADIDDVKGHALVAIASTEYMFVRNIGVGLRYMYSDVSGDVNKTDFNGRASWRMNSVSLYAKFLF
jgi:hypothetical protein